MKTERLTILLAAAILLISSLARCDEGDRPAAAPSAGRTLFLKNCAHCHGADAHGDDGPDLHKLDLSDDRIANRIRKGKPGQMTAFAGKLKASEIDALVSYVQTLK